MTAQMLFHYTCEDAAQGVRSRGMVLTKPQPLLGNVPMSWWTDLATPIREGLGLTSLILSCDRTECRFEATYTEDIEPWTKVRRWFPRAVELESAPGAMPMHWWVAFNAVSVQVQVAGEVAS